MESRGERRTIIAVAAAGDLARVLLGHCWVAFASEHP
jgi:hypothetical protein